MSTSILRPIIECVAGPSRPLQTRVLVNARALSTSRPTYSGHNRWSKIRHKKGAVDAQRSAIFSRLTNEIHQAMKPPLSPDPLSNPRLALALQKAKEGGVPKSGVENVLARARAAADGSGQGVVYEAVAAGGKAGLIIECMTDNPTRTVSRVKELLNKYGGRMAPTSYLFERKGLITLESTSSNKSPTLESLLDTALDLDLNVEDARLSADSPSPSPSPSSSEEEVGVEFQFELITPLSDLQEITQSFSKPPLAEFWAVTKSEVSYEPLVGVEVLPEGEEDGDGIREDKAEGLIKLVDALEIEQDISKVWTNLAR